MNSDNLNNIWNEFLNKIEKQLIPISFDVWFKDTKLIDLKDDTAKVLVQSEIFKKELQRNFNTLIQDTFNEITGSNFKFEYITEDEFNTNISLTNKEVGVPEEAIFETNLIDKYTFDNFVTGSNNDKNKFAKAIAISVAEKPGQMYNPLYIYGSSGLGKTHLMHAIGNYITANSSKKVLYVTSEKFVEDFMQLYKKKNNESSFNDEVTNFKRKYRNIDVLIIDDIQYLEVVGGIQQEFFNTFQELHDNNKQIILASDRSPDDLKKLEERIRTRFTWGILVNIYPPDFDVRMDIIDKKLENNDLDITFPKEVKEYIASNCTSDVRRLEGAIRRVLAYATMMNGSDITLELAQDALKDILPSNIISKNKIETLQQIVCDIYNITLEDLKGKKRNSEIAVPRQIAMYIARKYINESFPKIGSDFGGKDHTTVMHSVNKISNEIKNNKDLEIQIKKIIEKLDVKK